MDTTIEHLDLSSVISLFDSSTLSELAFSCSDFSLTLKRPVVGTSLEPPLEQAKQPVRKEQPETETMETITSPIVGTFYLTPAPDAPPYVQVGSKVESGQVICTIEAMKLMNQLESDYSCEIKEILAKPEQLVEFGQPLFKVKKL
ncbi:MAG: acetyl-CoA carboxylase biotin carboxyl carrier protein [Sphaerochaetaceae bacterium]